MDLQEAKNYFKQYGGFHFHMGREEPARYRSYLALEIPPETEDLWRENLADAALELAEGAEDPVSWLRSVNDQVRSFRKPRPDYCRKLLQQLEALCRGPLQQRAEVLRLLAGSTADGKIGALYTLRQGGVEKRTLSRLVDSLADFTPEPWDNYTRTEREENLKKCRLVLARM